MTSQQANQPERLRTIKEAGAILGIPAWKLLRAAKAGIVPTYRLLNSRRLVRVSEIIAAIEASAEERRS